MDTPLPTIDTAPRAEAGALVEQQAGELNLEKFDLKKLALAHFGPWRADVAAVTAKFTGLVLDMPNASKVADAKSLVHRHVGKPIAAARAVEDALKKKLNGAKGDVSAELALIVAGYDEAAKPIRAQIEAAEAKIAEEKRIAAEREQQRTDAHRAGLAKLAGFVEHARGLPASRIADGIAKVEAIVIDPAAWEEFAQQAEEQKAVTLERMRKMHAEAVAEEARAAEAARIASEQEAERKRLAEERAELERQQAEFKAQQEAAAKAEREAQQEEAKRIQRDLDTAAAERASLVPPPAPAPALAQSFDGPDEELEAPQAGPAGDGSQTPNDGAASSPAAKAGSGPAAEEPMLKLGELCTLFGFTMTADFLASLGHAATPAPKGTGRLYRQADVHRIAHSIRRHLLQFALPEGEQQAA